MASLDYRLNHTFKECSSCGAWYNKYCGCSKGGLVDKIVRDPNKTPDSSQRPPIFEKICPKCGDPVEGLYCRQCALIRKKLEEVFQDFQDTSESSNDNTNVVNTPQEPFVFNQDPGENSSQSPPHIDHNCCYECGDSLDDIFCQRCTCESCGNGAHYGYNCPPKVPIISNPEPCHNQNVDEFPQTLPSLHPTCYSGDGSPFTYDSTPNFVNDSPNVSNPPPQPPTYSCEFYGNDAHYGYDCPPQIPIYYDDDDDEESSIPLRDIIISELPPCIAITPVLYTEEPVDSLIMEDEHLDTIYECDVPVCDNSTTFSNPLFDVNDDFSSSDDESFSDEDVPKEIYSNPLLDEEIISDKIDASIISSPMIDSLLGANLEITIFDPGYALKSANTLDVLATHSPVIDTLLPFSSKNKDKVFNHGVLASKEKSPPSSSHRGFKPSKLFHQKSPMLIYREDIPILDVPFLHFYPP
ncbi:hypothetical protein Tco_1383934 [Tanacetum coccineum]